MTKEGISALAESVARSGYAALVLDRLARQMCQLVESEASSILVCDRRAPRTAIAVAACGAHEETVGSRVPVPVVLGGPVPRPQGAGVSRGRFRRRRQGGRTRAHVTVPAFWEGRLRGALVAERRDEREFGPRELELLGRLAITAGAALEHVDRRARALPAIRARVGRLVEALGAHDGYTAGHAGAVVEWSCLIAERLRLSAPDLLELELGALLHDLGKVRVPEAVLRKPGALDDAERLLVNHHPVWGAELVESVPGLEPVATIVRFHHERWDGTGYPDGLRRERIPLASRIIAVCDAYEAMTSERPYRVALPPGAAASELCARAGTQFDPAMVDCFVRVLQETGWSTRPAVSGRHAVAMGGTR
jgi:HD-GYP domain-containing protein (c-di-GMP phosphodiesterase class II)